MGHRVGIVGAGDVVRRSYLPALSRRGDCHVRAICSARGESARAVASEYGIRDVSAGYEELLHDADIDAVFIATPPHLHREISERAMESRKHVLVEKPLCSTYGDCRSLLERAVAYEKVFYGAFNNQFREENLALRSRALAGDLGALELIDFEWFRTRRYPDKLWLYDRRLAGGGVLMDFGVHLVHLALGLLPDRKSYRAFSSGFRQMEHSVEDTAVAMVTVDCKTTVLVKAGWDMKLPAPARVILNVYGHAGSASNLDYRGAKTDGFDSLLADFFRHIESGTKVDLKLVDDTMSVVDALYNSSESGSPVEGRFS